MSEMEIDEDSSNKLVSERMGEDLAVVEYSKNNRAMGRSAWRCVAVTSCYFAFSMTKPSQNIFLFIAEMKSLRSSTASTTALSHCARRRLSCRRNEIISSHVLI